MILRKLVAACVLFTATAVPAAAQSLNYALQARASFESDGAQDLGLADANNRNNVFLDLSPRVLAEFDRSWTGFLRGRVFVPTGRVPAFDSGQPSGQPAAHTFAGLDELWAQYNGLTDYPGEALRVGRQLIRDDDGGWIAQNVDSIRGIFDTTLLAADLGVIHQLSAYRTDDVPIFSEQRHRTYEFGSIAGDWQRDDRIGFRVLHASDSNSLPGSGTSINGDSKLQDADLTWISLFTSNKFFVPTDPYHLSSRGEIIYLVGDDRQTSAEPGNLAGVGTKRTVSALAAIADFRWRPSRLPLQLGLAYVYSQGGGDHQFQQSGLQSNTAYFTGTQTLINRYSETLRAELGNLDVATAYVSLNLRDNDASLLFYNFRKNKSFDPIVTDNVSAVADGRSRGVGNGVDLVVSHFFGSRTPPQMLVDGGDRVLVAPRSSIRLRGSIFDPGSAYDSRAKVDYRVILEGTLWVF